MTGWSPQALHRLNERYSMFCQLIEGGTFPNHRFTFSAKDNLCTKEFQARAGSHILEGYRPPFDATPVHRMRQAGGLLIGKTNMDEFGFGTFSTNSAFGVPPKPVRRGKSLRRFQRRRGRGGMPDPGPCRAWSVHRRFDLLPGLLLRGGRPDAHLWSGLALWPDRLRQLAGQGRPAVPLREGHRSGSFRSSPGRTQRTRPLACSLPWPWTRIREGPLALPTECLDGLAPEVKETFLEALDRLSDHLGVEVHEVSMP